MREKEREKIVEDQYEEVVEKRTLESLSARARNNFSWDASDARHEAAHFKHLSYNDR